MIKTLKINTNSEWQKVEDLFGIELMDGSLYAIQILGTASISYGDSMPEEDKFIINFPNPFTYEKKSGQDLYVRTDYYDGVTMTIAE